MDYTGVFKRSGLAVWRYKLLWLLGLLLMVGTLPSLIATHYYIRFVFSIPDRIVNSADPDRFFLELADTFLDPTFAIAAVLVLFLVFAIIWIITTIGEAALIRSVADYADGRTYTFAQMLSIGTKLLVRIIAIDTVIFFPLFLILLVILLTVGAGLIGGILQLAQGGSDPGDLGPIFLLVALFVMFLIALAVPVTILSLMFRVVAFRSAVLEDLTTRPSIRRAWELIRAKIGQIIVVFLLLYAVSYAIGMVTSILVMPIGFGSSFIFTNAMTQNQLPSQSMIDTFLVLMTVVSLIGLIPNMFYRIFYSAVWTMTYREWLKYS